MNPPQTFPDLRAWPPAFRHEGERVFACTGVIERHKVREARSLALSIDMIQPGFAALGLKVQECAFVRNRNP